MICDFCRTTVLESERRWDYHHRHAASLEASAQSGCIFCTRLAEDLGTVSPWFDGGGGGEAVYRWNIRQAHRTRHTQSHVSVRFRPVPGRGDGARRSEHLPDVQFHLYPKDDFDSDADETDLGAATDSDQTLRRMRAWVDDCVNHHPECARRHAGRDFVPTRLLDLGPPPDGDDDAAWPPSHVRVVDTNETPIGAAPYLTLSHCWGDGAFVQLTADTLAAFTTRGVPWEDGSDNDNDNGGGGGGGRGILSNATFAQALRVVRQLGQRYLWIDSLCIIQGKGAEGAHVDDWKAEAPLMHRVYRNSFCNIAAADSRNHTEGLFRPRRQTGFAPVYYAPAAAAAAAGRAPSKVFGDTVWRVLEHDHWDRGLLSRHLYTRGWVFQERLLSPRLLHFGAGQVFWDCAALSASESLPDGLPAALDDAAAAAVHRSWRRQLQGAALSVPSLAASTADSLRGFWADAVRAYTACNLTVSADRLAAVWGVAKLVRDALGEEYGAGLWTNGLHEQLAWRVAAAAAAAADDRRGAGDGFPSWSWASVKGAVEVASPVPDLPRFYTASGHDGGAVRFLLKNPIFGRFEGEHSASWKEELVIMARKLEETSSRVSRKAAAKAVHAFAPVAEESHDKKGHQHPDKPGPPGGRGDLESKGPDAKDAAKERGKDETGTGTGGHKEAGSAKPGPGGKDAAKKRHPADMPPQLLSNEIPIQAHVCRGALQRSAEDGGWTVAVSGVTQSDAVVEAFPDSRPHGEGGAPCELLLLAVSKEVCDELGDWVPDDGYFEEEEVFGTHYSGSALLVERAGEGRFRRAGAVLFRQLDADSWRCLRRACGQDEAAMEGELEVEDGQKVWLL
ncbi:HET-domain-containing protein [Colletotrichum falcatum]|nr:HET-domain-containing protein [Colletotrichum falcatum]